MPNAPIHLRATLPVLVIAVFTAGVFASYHELDPHWLNRAGAAIAALSAGAILLQVKAELTFETERDRLEGQVAHLNLRNWSPMPVENLETRLAIRQLEEKNKAIGRQRLFVAMFVVVTAIVGELLHGFGDLLICAAKHLPACH